MRKRVAVDAGGTFVDVVNPDGSFDKVLSSAGDPGQTVLEAVAAGGPVEELAHGTTLVNNVLLEGRGSPVALYLSGPGTEALDALVPRHLRFEVPGRINPHGRELKRIGQVPDPPAGVSAAAVVLQNASANPAHEQAVAGILRQRGLDVTASSDILAGTEEYDRIVATVVNASLLAPSRVALLPLAEAAGSTVIMSSAGGLLPFEEALKGPAELLFSSPSGGVLAALAAVKSAGLGDAVTFDMGGTSTEVCLLLGGQPATSSHHSVAGVTIGLLGIDVRTIGVGGGSIARIDAAGAVVVGPQSAGASPGPACYGLGGTEPTVTDADVVSGRLPAGTHLPGLAPLDVDAARRVLADAAVSADQVLAVVIATAAEAIRRVASERNVDLRTLALVGFGGAGPLHACQLADALGMATVVIPARAGVLSAVGLLGAARRVDAVMGWPDHTDYHGAEFGLASLVWVARSSLGTEGVTAAVDQLYDCRYAGHDEVLSTRGVKAFHGDYQRRFGTSFPDLPVEVVALRATARLPSPVSLADLPDPGNRAGPVSGPASIVEPDCTVWVAEGWQATVEGGGAWVLRRMGDS